MRTQGAGSDDEETRQSGSRHGVSAKEAAVYVGLDLGTSGLKGVALDGGGRVLGRARASYQTARPAPGAAEQDPADWLSALAVVVAALAATVPAARWRAVGLSGMLPTLVRCDGRGQAIGPAVTWQDSRAESDGARLSSAIGARRLYELTGQRVDGRYLLAMYARAARDEPGGASRARTAAGAKDYLFAWLTGHLATDPSTAAGFGCYGLGTGAWLPEVLEASELDGQRAPALPPVEPSESWRPLLVERARTLALPPGLPICLGGADSVLGALAAGAVRPGDVAYLAGTSSVVLGVSATPQPDRLGRYLVTPLAGTDGWGLEMDLLSTGSAMQWLADAFALPDAAAVADLATGVEPSAAPLFLPYLAPGEQGALWDPRLSGAIIGLTIAHSRAHVARGLLNGIVLESQRCLAVLGEHLSEDGTVYAAGHGATLAPFPDDLADASGRVVRTGGTQPGDHSAVGAAILAASSVDGRSISLEQTTSEVARKPRRERRELWNRLAEAHDRALDALRHMASEHDGPAHLIDAETTTPPGSAAERTSTDGR